MTINTRLLASIPLFEVRADHFVVDGVDHARLSSEVLASQQRLSNDPRIPLFEDTLFAPSPDSEGARLVERLSALFGGTGLAIVELWSQVHRPGESTNTHHHGNNAAAFVYYVAVPEGSGLLCFEFEDGSLHSIAPQEGHLYVFPAWAKHKVTKNIGAGTRISISGNLIYAQ